MAHTPLFRQYVNGLPATSPAVVASKDLVEYHWAPMASPIASDVSFAAFAQISPELFAVGQQRDAHDGWVQIRNALGAARESELFNFQLETSVICRRARSVTRRLDAAEELQITLEQSSEPIALTTLIRQYLAREHVESYTCPDGERGAYRQIKLASAPRLLVVQLKRYRHIIRNSEMHAQKITTPVLLPEDLDLESMPGHPAGARYTLTGVVSHFGSYNGDGHYVADFVHPTNQGWIRASDSTTQARDGRPTDTNSDSYLILFQRADA